MYKLRSEPILMPRHGKSRQHTDNTSTLSLHPPTLPPIPLPSLESQRIFPVDPRHFILRIPRDTETPTNLRIPPSQPQNRELYRRSPPLQNALPTHLPGLPGTVSAVITSVPRHSKPPEPTSHVQPTRHPIFHTASPHSGQQ